MIKIIDCEQRSDEWFAARRGVLTASEFCKVFTSQGKPSTQLDGLLYETLAEIEAPEPGWEGNAATARGTMLEPEARSFFELETGLTVEEVGFVRNGHLGASPDGFTSDGGGVEIKCPLGHTHLKYLHKGKVPATYIPQVHGAMVVTGRRHWWFLSYHPAFPPLLHKVEWDDFTDKLESALEAAVRKLKKFALELNIELP